ncbi:MAG: hypothetical protein KAF40_09965 [Flavihumibacter sp.]|nr:hypothetical protein [Flavihumibacter sp.]
MQLPLILAIILPFFQRADKHSSIESIAVPAGFARPVAARGSYTDFLRKLALKENKTVYYYTGQPKPNQQAAYAVLDIPVRNNSLLQCADAVMLIRATWLFDQKKYEQIHFLATDGTWLNYIEWCKGVRYVLKGKKLLTVRRSAQSVSPEYRSNLDRFLQQVFAYCGTASLSRQMKRKSPNSSPETGDVFLQPGHPGHVMLVVDMAKNAKGEAVFILLQGFMPAQDIHLVKSVQTHYPQPWQRFTNGSFQTPEWNFPAGSLYQW